MTRSNDIRCGSSGNGELALMDAIPRALRCLSATALASLTMLVAAGCGRAPIQPAGGPNPAPGSFVETLPVGSATITWERVGDKWPDASTVTVRRPGHPAEVRTCDSVAPPWCGMGGEGADMQAADLRAMDPDGRAPLLARCIVPGSNGQWFVAWLTTRYAATSALDTLTIVPVINGGLGDPVELEESFLVGTGDGLRVVRRDFAESALIVPGHGFIAEVRLRWDGNRWTPDIEGMRKPELSSSELGALAAELRSQWRGCMSDDCCGEHERIAPVLAELIYSGNSAQAWRLLEQLLKGRPARDRAFVELFIDELHTQTRHLDVARALNCGSLGRFERPTGAAKRVAATPRRKAG